MIGPSAYGKTATLLRPTLGLFILRELSTRETRDDGEHRSETKCERLRTLVAERVGRFQEGVEL